VREIQVVQTPQKGINWVKHRGGERASRWATTIISDGQQAAALRKGLDRKVEGGERGKFRGETGFDLRESKKIRRKEGSNPRRSGFGQRKEALITQSNERV